MRILALTKYGPMAASTRQRFVQFAPALAEAGIVITYAPLLDDDHVKRIADGRSASPVAIAAAYWRRLLDLISARSFDALWVHCELLPYLPGAFERLAFVHARPVIYDYDDAIFHMYDSSSNAAVRWLLGRKLEPLIRGAAAVCAGNAYLAEYAAQFNDQVVVLPTVVDMDAYRPLPSGGGGPVTIGWIGSPSTWPFVRPILPVLTDLCRDRNVRFTAIGAGPAALNDQFEGMTVLPWSEASEIAEVQAMDIGIMPLPDEPWARGKCGYKLIQYMACGLAVVASPVGVNRDLVQEGHNGFLAADGEQWRASLSALIADRDLRRRFGEAGRICAEQSYSLASQLPRLVGLFRSVFDGRSAPLD